jgi:hypothetical protein
VRDEENSEEEENEGDKSFFFKNVKDLHLPALRNFEAMDHIYDHMRQKTEDNLLRLEPLIKRQLNSLYYERKVSLYMLTKERKKQEAQDVERMLQKTKK